MNFWLNISLRLFAHFFIFLEIFSFALNSIRGKRHPAPDAAASGLIQNFNYKSLKVPFVYLDVYMYITIFTIKKFVIIYTRRVSRSYLRFAYAKRTYICKCTLARTSVSDAQYQISYLQVLR